MTEASDLDTHVRAALAGVGTVREVKMFGGIGFMLNGNLIAGASRRGLLLRVGKQQQQTAISQPGARPMVMRGRTMEDYIYVDPPALDSRAVKAWIRLAVEFVQTLPAKKPRPKSKTKTPVKAKTPGRTRTAGKMQAPVKMKARAGRASGHPVGAASSSRNRTRR